MIAMLFLLFSSQAQAALTYHELCVEFTSLSFTDGSTGDYLTGSTIWARGVQLKTIDQTTDEVVVKYTDWEDGPDAGCATFNIDTTHDYEVKLVYKASVNGNTVSVRNNSGVLFAQSLGIFDMPGSAEYVPVVATAKAHPLIAMISAIKKENGGLTGQDYRLYLDTTAGATGAGWASGKNNPNAIPHIRMVSSLSKRKYSVGHEMGHAVGDMANTNGKGNNFVYSAPMDLCSPAYPATVNGKASHKLLSREYQSAAATEGLGHFYAAIVWNSPSASPGSCEMSVKSRQNWNADTSISGVEAQTRLYLCDDTFDVDGFTVPYPRYDTDDRCGVRTAFMHRSTEFDWLRMFWDLRMNHGWSNAMIFEVWDRADPHNWVVAEWPIGGTDQVDARMRSAVTAYDAAHGTAHLTDYITVSAAHGTDQ